MFSRPTRRCWRRRSSMMLSLPSTTRWEELSPTFIKSFSATLTRIMLTEDWRLWFYFVRQPCSRDRVRIEYLYDYSYICHLVLARDAPNGKGICVFSWFFKAQECWRSNSGQLVIEFTHPPVFHDCYSCCLEGIRTSQTCNDNIAPQSIFQKLVTVDKVW